MRTARYARAPAFATGAIVAAGFALCVILNWPGHLSYDSIVQLYEGRTGRYGGWHPPVMSWLLGLGDSVVPGAGLFVLLDSLLLYAPVGALVLIRARPSIAGIAVALAMIASPQFLLYPAIVWKDVLFAASATAGFVSLTFAAHFWPLIRARAVLLAASVFLLVLAALARQNGLVVLPVAALSAAWIAYASSPARRSLIAALHGAVWLGTALLVCACALMAFQSRGMGLAGPAGQFRLLDTYDLAGALASDPALELDRLDEAAPELAMLMRTVAARLYSPQRNDTLARSSPLQVALRNADGGAIEAQWRQFVWRHPQLYLSVRWAAFRQVFLTPDLMACRPGFVGVRGPPDLMGYVGEHPRLDRRDRALAAYVLSFVDTPVLSHATFAMLGLVLLVLLLRRRRPEDIAMAAMLGSAFAFTASFFVISIACDYRYLYFLDTASLVAAFYCSLDADVWLAEFRRRAGAIVGFIWRAN